MVRIYVEPPKGEAENAVNNWVQNHTEWTDEALSKALRETAAEIDNSGTAYVTGDYLFVQDTPATDLLDNLESRLQAIQNGLWYRIGYHACDHDGELTPCSWDGTQTRENGTIPSDIPDL